MVKRIATKACPLAVVLLLGNLAPLSSAQTMPDDVQTAPALTAALGNDALASSHFRSIAQRNEAKRQHAHELLVGSGLQQIDAWPFYDLPSSEGQEGGLGLSIGLREHGGVELMVNLPQYAGKFSELRALKVAKASSSTVSIAGYACVATDSLRWWSCEKGNDGEEPWRIKGQQLWRSSEREADAGQPLTEALLSEGFKLKAPGVYRWSGPQRLTVLVDGEHIKRVLLASAVLDPKLWLQSLEQNQDEGAATSWRFHLSDEARHQKTVTITQQAGKQGWSYTTQHTRHLFGLGRTLRDAFKPAR